MEYMDLFNGLHPNSSCAFGFTLNNEFFLEHAGYMVLYDPFANKEKILDDKIVEYVESLVWVAPVMRIEKMKKLYTKFSLQISQLAQIKSPISYSIPFFYTLFQFHVLIAFLLMANAEDEISPYASGGAGEKLCKMPFRPEIYEEAQNVSHEAGRDISCLSSHQCGNFATFGKSELEEMLKQMTFTRSEAHHFISLLHSRTIEEEKSPTPVSRLEASISSGSLKRHKHGDESHNFREEEIASPADLANVFKGSSSTICRQVSKLINNNATSTHLPITSPQHPATMENLPDELLTNIFIRLLAKQLAQMRSVSKFWNALLSQSSFIKSHLHHSIHNKDQILLVFHDEEKFSFDIKPLTAIPTRSPSLELTNFIKLPINPQPERINGIKIIGSVNGLICSRYGDSIIHIWNPSLSTVLTLPPYSTPSRADNELIRTYFQFGYDPKTDDYKVVKLTGLHGPYLDGVKWWLQIEIYSMRNGSWELITERFPSHVAVFFNEGKICIHSHDGHLHWIGYTKKDDSESIVAFDLGSATFSEIPLPDSTLDSDRFNEVGVLADKLYVLSYIREDNAYEVWVMDGYGVAESWVKRFVFPQFTDGRCPFGFTLKTEFLIEYGDYLVLYDPFANEDKLLDGYCPEEQCIDKIVEYVESLVWVAPIHEEPQNISHEASQNVSCLSTHECGSCGGIFTVGKSELEQILKQMTFSRSESHHFISLMHSRTIEEESPTPFSRVEASSTSGSVKRHKHGDERDDFHASVSSSRVLDEALRRDSKLINNNSTCLSITSEASPQPPATIENLPDELLSNIFIRLLAKQLAQMRSDQVLLVFYNEGFSYNLNPFTAKPSQSPSLRVNNFIKLPVNPQSEYRNGITIIGSVNGLICSCYGDFIIHIWNPSLSTELTLPPYSTPSRDNYKVVKHEMVDHGRQI
ncbi:hypothetical protein LXL04_028493 [Taraxacum kok-saghyz]